MQVSHEMPRRNPFATRYVASARLLPRDDHGGIRDLRAIVSRLESFGGSGAIVGPHGTGKSTLLSHLGDCIAATSRSVACVRLRCRRDTAAVVRAVVSTVPGGLVCIDSWELLGGPGRFLVRGLATIRGVDLLVTAHRAGGLPTVVTCRGTRAVLGALVADLPDHDRWFGATIRPADLDAAFAAADGDIREALDLLYDRFERGRIEPSF